MYTSQSNANRVPDSSATQFSLTINGAELHIHCCQPSEWAIGQYRRALAQFALLEREGGAYFLSNFGDIGWMEAPFHAAINPQQVAGVPPEFVAGRHHIGLLVKLRDSNSHASYGGRFVTLSKPLSARLVDVAKEQLATPISTHEYEMRIQRAFSLLTPSQMASMATLQ